MQIRYATHLSIDEYILNEAWKDAHLDACPLHPDGECKFSRHGTYKRQYPEGVKISRWYCALGHQTFSLLPDCLASHMSGTLEEIEDVIVQVENAKTQTEVAQQIRLDIELPGVFRWLRRRIGSVQIGLILLGQIFPSLFQRVPQISSLRSILNVDYVLPHIRKIAQEHLYELPPPVGFGPKLKKNNIQHKTGTDPPLYFR